MKKQVIAYVHTHWDREWYREFEIFRMRLLRVFDNVLDLLSADKIPSFYFDGQTSALSDYLEIRPEKQELVARFIKEKKLFIGPFYCLADEFLTDETCFRKNLEFGLQTAKEFGCTDFVGYFADTFGHSAGTIKILKEYGIDTAIVWRGCGDLPSEFKWCDEEGNSINTINLIRGYFNDIFSADITIEEKTEFLKNNLDKISEKSGDILLLPIGADHLGVESDLAEQISQINKVLDNYEIKLGSLFDYIEKVKPNFEKTVVKGELRDNSKTFILEGSYSSRLDLKAYNIKSVYKLDLANRLVKHFNSEANYKNLIDYAYKLLLQNQAHDSICGCSTDDVHSENIARYRKILQIADTIVEEIRFEQGYKLNTVINLYDNDYKGSVCFKSNEVYSDQIISVEKGFPPTILVNTSKIPITEDYTDIYTYCKSLSEEQNDVFITDKCIGNSNIFLSVEDNQIKVGDKTVRFIDFEDNGDSYNTGYVRGDRGKVSEIVTSKIIRQGAVRSTLGIELNLNSDILHLEISLDNHSTHLDFTISWQNTRKNHLTELVMDTGTDVTKTYSEDFNRIIEREFEPDYDVRENLPKEKGKEVKANNAPMQRGVTANGIGIVGVGLTQYEVYKTELRIPILRATGLISNPKNPARTTPAGPPIFVSDLQQSGENKVRFGMFLGEDLESEIDNIFNGCIVI